MHLDCSPVKIFRPSFLVLLPRSDSCPLSRQKSGCTLFDKFRKVELPFVKGGHTMSKYTPISLRFFCIFTKRFFFENSILPFINSPFITFGRVHSINFWSHRCVRIILPWLVDIQYFLMSSGNISGNTFCCNIFISIFILK